MRLFLPTIISGILGLWLAIKFVPGADFTGDWKLLLITGLILGLINFFVKPILKAITLPLRIVTFGLFSLVINILIVWLVDICFEELVIVGIPPLLLTTLIIWGLSTLLYLFFPKRSKII